MRFGYVHFAFLGAESFRAAEASECANDQDKFWEYHDALFEHQSGENQGAFSDANLKALAGTLQLDQAKFDQCLDAGTYTDLVKQEVAFGQQLGVQSTPTFALNGQPIVGGQPFDVFKQLIEAGLAQ